MRRRWQIDGQKYGDTKPLKYHSKNVGLEFLGRSIIWRSFHDACWLYRSSLSRINDTRYKQARRQVVSQFEMFLLCSFIARDSIRDAMTKRLFP